MLLEITVIVYISFPFTFPVKDNEVDYWVLKSLYILENPVCLLLKGTEASPSLVLLVDLKPMSLFPEKQLDLILWQ